MLYYRNYVLFTNCSDGDRRKQSYVYTSINVYVCSSTHTHTHNLHYSLNCLRVTVIPILKISGIVMESRHPQY